MQVAVIADAYPPLRTSGAVQLKDLVAEFADQGHNVTVILPDPGLTKDWQEQRQNNVNVLRLKAPRTKDVSYFKRAIAEYRLSGVMYKRYCRSPFSLQHYDGIIWYSPTIFLGELVGKLKQISGCQTYLILRDIFPEWAVDMALLKRGIIYRYFKSVEKFQYRQANTIGVQTPSNIMYFTTDHPDLEARIEVLNNWLSVSRTRPSSIQIANTHLAGRKIFAYTGNIGIAQGMDILMELANAFREDPGVGFLFVGRGSAVAQIRQHAVALQLDNVLIHDEIEPDEIADLLAQCDVGLIALDPRHRNDNIPGKFLAYMQAGLPVLATINPGNDLEVIIKEHRVGEVITSHALSELKLKAEKLLQSSTSDDELKERCLALSAGRFSSFAAVQQIVAALNNQKK